MYDVAVIGAGWAGFTAAREAFLLGRKVCLIEKNLIGGTCLNAGCIPTKTLVQSAKTLDRTKKALNFGITTGPVSFDMPVVQQRKEKVMSLLRRGMESRLSGIDLIREEARLLTDRTIKAGERTIEASCVIVCSGSCPRPLKGFEFDGSKILSSDDALKLVSAPSSLLVIGGGIIGCEFASIFSSFGSAVTIVEVCDHLIPGTDTDMARKLETSFRKKGIKVHTKADPAAFDLSAYEKVLVCVGRVPRTEGVQDAGIAVERGRIVVDDFMMTSVPGVYAAGDCTGRLMLAHVAAAQGRVAARNCAAGKPAEKISYSGIPSCIFTSPEIACVGISEDEAMKRGITVKEYGFDLMGSGMAQVMGETEGMIKILADIRTDEVVGAFVIGPNACELGGTLTLAVQTSMKISDLKRTVFAHPSLTEAISETLI